MNHIITFISNYLSRQAIQCTGTVYPGLRHWGIVSANKTAAVGDVPERVSVLEPNSTSINQISPCPL